MDRDDRARSEGRGVVVIVGLCVVYCREPPDAAARDEKRASDKDRRQTAGAAWWTMT